MQTKFLRVLKGRIARSSALILLLSASLKVFAGDVPVERDFLQLPNDRWIWLKKVDWHKTWIMLGRGEKSVKNRIWSKFYESDGKRHTWDYAFFVRVKPSQFVVNDEMGNPLFGLSTYDMGTGMIRWAIILRVLKDRLEVVEEVDNFNVAADESIYR